MMEKFLMFFFGMYAARCCALRGCAFEAFFDFAFLLPLSDEDGGCGDDDGVFVDVDVDAAAKGALHLILLLRGR